MPVKSIRTRDEQADATRAALLAAERRLFASRGFPDVSVDEIVQAARLTKGALYHHFRDKQEIFRTVVEQISHAIRERLRALRGDDAGVEASAQMLLGALNVAGRVIAQADDRSQARSEVGATIDRLLAGMAGAP